MQSCWSGEARASCSQASASATWRCDPGREPRGRQREGSAAAWDELDELRVHDIAVRGEEARVAGLQAQDLAAAVREDGDVLRGHHVVAGLRERMCGR